MDSLLAGTAEIVDRVTGARHQVPADQIALDASGIVVLTLQPADIDHLERSGQDLVIHLISGETITIAGFYADPSDSAGSELVLQGPDGSLWYWDQSSGSLSLTFLQISDIEPLLRDDDNDNAALPILLGLGALGLAGAVALAGEDDDDPDNPPDEDDTTPPTAPTAALADDTGEEGDGRTGDPTVNVGGLEPGATWEYSTDGGQTWTPGTGTSFELPPGEYDADDVQVRQTDEAGNTSDPGLLGPVIVDISPPAAPVETLENDTGTPGDGITTDGTILVSGIEPDATWEYSTDGGQTWLPGTGSSFELPPGEYEAGDVQVRQTDQAGNTSTPGLLGPITVDTGIPAAPTAELENDTGTPGDGITSDGTVEVGGLEPGATWEYSTDGGASWSPGTGTTFDLAPGTYDSDDVQVRQADIAGNTSDEGLLGPVTIDTSGPSTAGASATISVIAGDDVVNAAEAALDVPVTVTLAGVPPDAASTTVTVNVGGTDYVATDNGDGTWTASVPGSVAAANSSVTATAIFTDTAGNASAPVTDTRPYTVDTGVPAAPTATLENDTGTPGDGITSDGTVEVGNLEPGATWEYSTNGGASWTPGTGTSFDLAPGTYDADDVQVRQTDTAGNTSDEGLLGPATIDTGIPAAPTATLESDTGTSGDGTTSDGTVEVGGLEPNATWEYSTDGGTSWTPGTGASFDLAPGTYDADDVQVRQTDLAGNTSDEGLLSPVTVDTTGPATAGASATISPIAGDDVVNAAEAAADVPVTVTLSGVPPDAASTVVTINVAGTDYAALDNGDGTWTAEVPGSAIAANTSVTATAIFTDTAGNDSAPVNDTRPYTVDTSLPAAPTADLENDTGTPGDGITSDGTVEVGGLEPGATWEYSTDGGTSWSPGTGPTFDLAPGTYDADDVQVRQTDTAGNTSDEGLLGPVTVDTTGPSTAGASATISPIAGDDVVNAAEAAADVPVTVTLTGVPPDAASTVVTINVGGTDYAATDNGDGTWTAEVPGSAIAANTSVTATAIFTDTAGNDSAPVTDTRPYTVDTSLPAAPTATLENDTGTPGDNITSDGTVEVGNLEPGATWEYSTNGGATWLPGTGASFDLAPGTYDADDVQIRQTDTAGNTSDEGLLGPVTVDTTGPATAGASATISPIAGDDVVNAAEAAADVPVTVTLTGVPPDAASTTVAVNVGGTDYTATSNGDGTWTADVPGSAIAANTSVTATAVFTDTAGNDSAPITDTRPYIVDTSLPAAPTATLENDTGTPGDSITSDGTVEVGGLEPGATWEYSTNGGASWSPGTGTTFDLAPGTYDADDVQVRQTDTAGNTSDEGLLGPVTVDTTGPSTAGASATISVIAGDDVVNAAEASADIPITVTLAGVPPDAASTVVTVNVGGADYPALDNGDGTWTAEVPGSVVAGATSATATAVFTDVAGNDSAPVTDTRPYTIDASLPPAPTPELENDTGIPGDGITSDGTVEVSGVEPGAAWEYSSDGGATWDPGTGTSFELLPGTYDADDVQVRQTDTEGNTSGVGLLGPVTIDTTGPSTAGASATISPIAGDDVVNAAEAALDVPVTVTLAGVPPDAASTTVTVNVGGTDYAAIDNGDGTWTAEVPGTAIAANTSVTATAIFADTAGNDSAPVTDTRPYAVDTGLPAAPTATLENDTGTPGDGITSDGTVDVGGLEPGATWEYSTNGGTSWSPGTGTTFELPPGTYDADDVQVRQTDTEGNTSGVGLLGPVTIDTTGPSTAGASATISPIAGDDVVNAAEAALDVPVTVTLAGVPPDALTTVVIVNVGGIDYTATSNGDGTWTAEVPGTAIAANTSVTATAIFTDTAGNASAPVTDTRPYSVDIGLPAAPTATLENDTGTPGDGITSDGTVEVGNLEPGATWEYSTNGGATWLPGTGTSFELAPGTYDADDVQVRQTDTAGNTSDEGLLGPVTIDVSLDAVNDSTTLDMGEVSETEYAPQTTTDVLVLGLLESSDGTDGSAPVTVMADRSGELRIEISQAALVAVADAYRVDIVDADGNIVYQAATATSPLVGEIAGLQVLGLTGDNTLTATVTGLPPGSYRVVVHNDASALTELLDTDGSGVSLQELGDAGVVLGAENQAVILSAVSGALGPVLGPTVVLLLDPVLDGLNGLPVTSLLGNLASILNSVGGLALLDTVIDAVATALLSNTLTLLGETTITTDLTEYEFDTETIGGNVITGNAGLGVDDIGAGATVTQVVNADGTIELVPPGGSVTIAGEYGELTLGSDGSYTYNAYGSPMSVGEADVFTYTLSDGGASDTATLTITLDGEAVVAAADTATATFEWDNVEQTVSDFHSLSGALTARTTDSPVFTLDAATLASGTVVVAAGLAGVAMSGNAVLQEETSPGVWTNVPGTIDTFSVAIAVLGAELASINIGVLNLDAGNYRVHVTLNGSLVALAITVDTDIVLTHTDQFVLDEATGATGNLLTNDAEGSGATQLQIQNDADVYVGGPVTVQGTYGTLTVQADGSYSYVPNPAVAYFDTPQVDSFNYQLVHPNGQVSQAALDVTVEPSGAGVAGFAGFSLMSFGFGDDTIPLGDFPTEPDAFFATEAPDLGGIVEPPSPDEATSVDALLDQFLDPQDADATPDSAPSVVPDTALPEPVEDPLGYLTPVPIDDQHLQHPTVV